MTNYVLEQGLARKASSHHGAFLTGTPTLNGASKDGTPSGYGSNDYGNSGGKKKSPDCFCGSKHWYSDCYYINPSKAPAKWQPNSQIQSRLDQKLAKDSTFKAQVERARRPNNNNYSKSPAELPARYPDLPIGAVAALASFTPTIGWYRWPPEHSKVPREKCLLSPGAIMSLISMNAAQTPLLTVFYPCHGVQREETHRN